MSKLNDYAKESVGVLSAKVKVVFLLLLSASLGLEYMVHRHSYFEVDGLPFFYAIFGFCSCALIILLSKVMGLFLKQPDDYYNGKEL